MKFATRAIHVGHDPFAHNRSVMPPVYQTSAFAYKHIGEEMEFCYARGGTPTRAALEACVASLENARYGVACGSGMAAIDGVLRALVKPGDAVVAVADLYGGAYRLLSMVMAERGVDVRFVDLTDPQRLVEALSPEVKVLWLETPTNPLLNIVDVAALADIAHQHGVVVALDNTFATPYLQNPIDLGADIVVHSATKYLGGHSDVLLGVIALNDEALYQQIKFTQNASGAVPGPQDCLLTLRGIKTLALRMDRHCDNAERVVELLQGHPAIERVFYPGLSSHPGHALAQRQMKRYGGMISIYLKDDSRAAASRVAERLQLFALAESLGGVESLVNHSFTMSHGAMPAAHKAKLGIREGLLRLSIGVEDIADILDDLKGALA